MQGETPHQRAARINKANLILTGMVLRAFEKRQAADPSYLQKNIIGYVIAGGGPYGLDLKIAIYSHFPVHDDGTPRMANTHLVLAHGVGGLSWFRYNNRDLCVGEKFAAEVRRNHERAGLLF